ncbi:MAG: membrane protein insertion efficiency factor YidD [Candidatus Marinimicrobia bacterium]|nr:membrane protein insertion efficiency factor YidD [Candidatus Neomarinimicrobiota bacterium]
MIDTRQTKLPLNAPLFSRKLVPVAESILSSIFVSTIRLYQRYISPFFLPRCRFHPTCSEYALKAFKRFSPIKAFILSLKRIIKCNPWGGSGSDPLPK